MSLVPSASTESTYNVAPVFLPSGEAAVEIRNCIVKIFDVDGVEHSVKVRTESVYEAALQGFERFDRLNLAKDDGCLIVEVYEERTVHRIQVGKMFGWLKSSGRNPAEEMKKRRLRELVKLTS